jgi:hypothetical protein
MVFFIFTLGSVGINIHSMIDDRPVFSEFSFVPPVAAQVWPKDFQKERVGVNPPGAQDFQSSDVSKRPGDLALKDVDQSEQLERRVGVMRRAA